MFLHILSLGDRFYFLPGSVALLTQRRIKLFDERRIEVTINDQEVFELQESGEVGNTIIHLRTEQSLCLKLEDYPVHLLS